MRTRIEMAFGLLKARFTSPLCAVLHNMRRERGRVEEDMEPIGERGRVEEDMEPIGERGRVEEDMEPIGERGRVEEDMEPIGERGRVEEDMEPIGERGRVEEDMEPIDGDSDTGRAIRAITWRSEGVMTPREQLRKMTALGEQAGLDEKHWYRMVNGMSAGELRQRQELLMRSQMAMAPQILAQGQQRLQVPSQLEPRFMERELAPPPSEMVSSEARQMHLGGHLGPPLPPHNMLPGRGFPGGAGYGFLPSEPMETVARRQELLHKQNIARMEMNAILQQKELETAHQKGLLGLEGQMLYQNMAFRGRQRLSDGHDVFVHQAGLEDLHGGLLMSGPYPPIGTLQRERGRRAGRWVAGHKSAEGQALKGPPEDRHVERSPGASGEEKEAKGEPVEEAAAGKTHHHHHHHHHQAKMEQDLSTGQRGCKEAELRKAGSQDGCSDAAGSAADKDVPGQCSVFQDKFLYPSPGAALPGMPYMFPGPGGGLLPAGPPSLFLNGDDVVEDVRKWTVDDVYNFVQSIPTCAEYAQVSRRLGSMFYMMNLPLSTSAALQAAPEKAGDRSSEISSPVNCTSEEMLGSPRDPDALKAPEPLHEPENRSPPPSETS